MQDKNGSDSGHLVPGTHAQFPHLKSEQGTIALFRFGIGEWRRGAKYRVLGTGFGVRPSAWTRDAGKVVSPLPLILPWPKTGYRAPRAEPGGLAPGDPIPGP
jgi:hypothetical protein